MLGYPPLKFLFSGKIFGIKAFAEFFSLKLIFDGGYFYQMGYLEGYLSVHSISSQIFIQISIYPKNMLPFQERKHFFSKRAPWLLKSDCLKQIPPQRQLHSETSSSSCIWNERNSKFELFPNAAACSGAENSIQSSLALRVSPKAPKARERRNCFRISQWISAIFRSSISSA